MTSGRVVARDTVFQETRPGAGFQTGDFLEEKLGGATVTRLRHIKYTPCDFTVTLQAPSTVK